MISKSCSSSNGRLRQVDGHEGDDRDIATVPESITSAFGATRGSDPIQRADPPASDSPPGPIPEASRSRIAAIRRAWSRAERHARARRRGLGDEPRGDRLDQRLDAVAPLGRDGERPEARLVPGRRAGRTCWRRPGAPGCSARTARSQARPAARSGRGRRGRGRPRAGGPGPGRSPRPRSRRPRRGGPPCRPARPASRRRRSATVTTSRVVPGRRVDDRPVVARQGVQEPALADVRPARQDHPPALDQPEPDRRPVDQSIQARERPRSGVRRRATRRSSSSSAPSAWSSRISAVRTRRGPGQVDRRPRPDRRPAPSAGPRPEAAGARPRAATRASTTSATAAGPPWHWTSTSGGSPPTTTATTSSPSPAPIRPTRSRPGGDRRQPTPRERAGTPRRPRANAPGPQTRTTATAPRPGGQHADARRLIGRSRSSSLAASGEGDAARPSRTEVGDDHGVPATRPSGRRPGRRRRSRRARGRARGRPPAGSAARGSPRRRPRRCPASSAGRSSGPRRAGRRAGRPRGNWAVSRWRARADRPQPRGDRPPLPDAVGRDPLDRDRRPARDDQPGPPPGSHRQGPDDRQGPVGPRRLGVLQLVPDRDLGRRPVPADRRRPLAPRGTRRADPPAAG